jgi:hypothetical protein
MHEARKAEIFASLRTTRILRWAAYGGVSSIFVAALLRLLAPEGMNTALDVLTEISWPIAILGFFLGFFVDARRCPLCEKRLFFWLGGAKWVKNPFSSECMNCGLRLDGSNLEQISSNLYVDAEPLNAAASR